MNIKKTIITSHHITHDSHWVQSSRFTDHKFNAIINRRKWLKLHTSLFWLCLCLWLWLWLCLNFTILLKQHAYLLWAKNWNFMVLADAAASCAVLLAYRFRRLISCCCRAAAIIFASKWAASQCFMYGLIGFKNGAAKRWIKRINRTWNHQTKHNKQLIELMHFAIVCVVHKLILKLLCWLSLSHSFVY